MYNADKEQSKPNLGNYLDSDLSNKLESSKEWHKLTELQKKICLTHWINPKLNKTEISKEVGCSVQTVYGFFSTPVYHKIALEIDKLDFRQIVELAKEALKDALQNGSPAVKGKLAVEVLKSPGMVMAAGEEVVDNKISVSWGEAVEETHEVKPSVPPTP